jgi:hypothetical protein
MSDILKDGTGKGNSAKVDGNNRLHTATVSRTEENNAIVRGDFFITSSGVITVTDDAETPLWYIKNNDSRNLYLGLYIISAGESTSGTGFAKTKTYAVPDPTSTIITEAKAGLAGNANLSSAVQFNGVVYRGETGDTVVGGANFNTIHHPAGQFNYQLPVVAVIPKGFEGCFTYTAPPGNTSQEVIMTIECYYLDEELEN